PGVPGEGVIAEQMQSHAMREVETADGIVLVRDLTGDAAPPPLPRSVDLVVWTKTDLARAAADQLAVSALTGTGIDEMRRQLDDLAFGASSGIQALALNARHLAAIAECRAA